MRGIIITVAILAVILGPGWYLLNLMPNGTLQLLLNTSGNRFRPRSPITVAMKKPSGDGRARPRSTNPPGIIMAWQLTPS